MYYFHHSFNKYLLELCLDRNGVFAGKGSNGEERVLSAGAETEDEEYNEGDEFAGGRGERSSVEGLVVGHVGSRFSRWNLRV